MYIYNQSTGELRHLGENDIHVAYGYSGTGAGRNNPHAELEANVGPIPQGDWSIGKIFEHAQKGPKCMRLHPHSPTQTKRSGFMIHGDNQAGDASEGCIILKRSVREAIAESGDSHLRVISGLEAIADAEHTTS